MNPLSKNIIADWGLSDLSEPERFDFAERVGHLIYQALLVRSLDILSTPEEEQLDALLDKDETTPEIVIAFLQQKIPTFNFLLKDEMRKLKEEVLV